MNTDSVTYPPGRAHTIHLHEKGGGGGGGVLRADSTMPVARLIKVLG